MILETGATYERYTVESKLGQGGNAVVYLVRHNRLGSRHALKVIAADLGRVGERLLAEGRAQAMLRHPNIVTVTDVLEINGAPALVMEYIEGPTLSAFLKQRLLTFEQADAIAIGILEGVAAAHAAGVVHRDLKPSNILCQVQSSAVVPKVSDFGLVKLLGAEHTSATRSGAILGTPAYMSPEQILDAKSVDARADVFSLGAILYHLVTGKRAFRGSDVFQIFAGIQQGRFEPLSTVAPELPTRMARAIEEALRLDPERRPADAGELLSLWRGGHQEAVVPSPWSAEALAEVSGSRDRPAPIPRAMEVETLESSEADRTAPSMDVRGLDGTRRSRVGVVLVGIAGLFLAATLTVGVAAVGVQLWRMGPDEGAAGTPAATEQASDAPAATGTNGAAVEPEPAAPELPPMRVPAPAVEAPSAGVEEAPEPVPVREEPSEAHRPLGTSVDEGEETAKTPEVAEMPDAEPSPPVADPATVQATGELVDAWLQSADGARHPLGEVAPGSYTLKVFFDLQDAVPVNAATFTVGPGEQRTFRCSSGLRGCR